MEIFIFYLIAAAVIISAITVVILKNIVHSALMLIVAFFSIAVLFLTMNAEFVGLVQLLIYVGAVSVILIFGIMLTRRTDIKESNPANRQKAGASIVSGALFIIITISVLMTDWQTSDVAPKESYVEEIPELVLVDLLLPFQLSGLLLLIAMVGAIILARGEKKKI